MVIGLTGGIASGKSLVASRFIALGVPLLEADDVAREVVEPGTPALERIAERFGPEVISADGALDRRKLRHIVFSDPDALKQLEAITHPPMRQRISAWISTQNSAYCVLSAAIMVESGLDKLVDRILLVDVPEAVQLQRLQSRDGIDETLARQMMASQSSRAARLEAADDVIVNDGDMEQTLARVDALHQRFSASARTD